MPIYIADMHCDTIACCVAKSGGAIRLRRSDPNKSHIDIERLKLGGVMLQCFAIYMFPPNEWRLFDAPIHSDYEFFEHVYGWYKKEMDENRSAIRPAMSYGDIEANLRDGIISSLLAIEDGVVIGDKIERLDALYDKGVRLITLTWNNENCIGYPGADPRGGLKPFGIEALSRMNELGIIADVSHLSDAGFFDVARFSKKPFVASHSNARALCAGHRNLTDDMLKALGDAGGAAGINFASDFLVENATYAFTDDIVRHARYMADKAGVEAVAFGSDFDGISTGLEFTDCSGFPMIVEALHRAFTAREVDLITHKNVLRVVRDNVGD